MDTLSNVITRWDGNSPLAPDLPPTFLPKVQSPPAKNFHTGVTSNFVPKEKHHGLVLRALYGRTCDAVGALKNEDISVYVPMHYDKVEISGKERLRKTPFLPGLVFCLHDTQEDLCLCQAAGTDRHLKYYTNKRAGNSSNCNLHDEETAAF